MGIGEICHRLPDLHGVAGAQPQSLVHVGNQNMDVETGAFCRPDNAVGEPLRLLHCGHECARAYFDVHDQPVITRGDLFGKDRGRDQRDRLHGAGDIADGVKPAIRRRQITGLPDNRAADGFDDAPEKVQIRGRTVAGDAVDFVQSAAGVAETTTRDHRHVTPTGGGDRCQQETHLVADSPRRMLIDHRPAQVVGLPVQHGARGGHRRRQRSGFPKRHRTQEDGHGQRRDLFRRNAAVGQALDEKVDFLPRQLAPIPLFSDNVGKQHRSWLWGL